MSKRLYVIIALLTALFNSGPALAQDPNVAVFIDNPQYISPTQYEFDIVMKATGSTSSFQLRTFQAGLFMSSSWVNGGTITASIAPGFSEMTGNGYDGSFQWNNTDKLLNCSVNLGVRPSSAVCLSTSVTQSDMRVVRIRLTNTASFGCSSPDIAFNYSQNANPLRLRTTFTWRPSGCNNFDMYYPNRTFTGSARFNNELLSADVDGRSPVATQFNVGNCSPILKIKAFVQGYYLGAGQMQSTLMNQGVARVSYSQTDTITVELRPLSSPSTVAFSSRVVLMVDGSASVVLSGVSGGQYYVVLKNQNLIQTWSANPLSISSGLISYDFSDALAKTYGSNSIQVENGVYALFNGDVNQDGGIDISDYALTENDANDFAFGYYPTDCNGDAAVDITDMALIENNGNLFVFYISPE